MTADSLLDPELAPLVQMFPALVLSEEALPAIRAAVAGGASAGGGLAAALSLLARDRRGPSICHQLLIYPMLDDRTVARDVAAHIGASIWTPENNAFAWRALLGHAPGDDNASRYASPARADSLGDLPPAFIDIGALDLFVEESCRFACRLAASGVPVELHVYPGAVHGFDLISAAVSKQAQALRAAALAKAFGKAMS